MTTIAFDSSSSPRARPSKAPSRRPSAVAHPGRTDDAGIPVAAPLSRLAPAPARPAQRRSGTFLLVLGIAGLHLAGVAALGGTRSQPARIPAPPIAIALVAPRAEPPPPPPAPAPRPQQVARAKAPAPVARPAAPPAAASAPLVASDAPLSAPSPETVQVATAPGAPAAPPAPAAPEKVTEPRGYAGYLNNPAPAYPPAAQKRGLEGQVVLKVHVLATGHPDNVTVARSSGHAILDEAALKAVAQWTFEPARRGQSAIDGWVQVPLNFKI